MRSVTDHNERLRQELLEEASTFFGFMDRHVLNGVLYYDLEADDSWVSEGFRTGLGYAPDDPRWLDRETRRNMLYGPGRAAIEAALSEAASHPGTVLDFLMPTMHADGTVRHYRMRGVFMTTVHGPRFAVVNLDVTDLVEVNERLTAANEQLFEARQANDLMASFSRLAAHDLRAPARRVLQFANRLRRTDSTLDARGEESLQAIERAARQMLETVEGIRQLGSIDRAARMDEETDLDAVFRRVAGDLDMEDTLRLDRLPSVRGNAEVWTLAVQNLLVNARTHGRPADQGLEVRITRTTVDGHPALRLADNGAGFSTPDPNTLFQLFQRSSGADGDGIGLAVVQRVASLFGYRWTAEHGTGDDEGAVLTLHLLARVDLAEEGIRDFRKEGWVRAR
jgi:signal transduction histidine kinase